jgi:hypothetical protein
VTIQWARSAVGSIRATAARAARSGQDRRGLGLFRRSTATSCRSRVSPRPSTPTTGRTGQARTAPEQRADRSDEQARSPIIGRRNRPGQTGWPHSRPGQAADRVQAQRRGRQERPDPLAVLGSPLPHPRIHRTGEKRSGGTCPASTPPWTTGSATASSNPSAPKSASSRGFPSDSTNPTRSSPWPSSLSADSGPASQEDDHSATHATGRRTTFDTPHGVDGHQKVNVIAVWAARKHKKPTWRSASGIRAPAVPGG